MVLEMRAETVTKLRSGETEQLCGWVVSEERSGLVAVRCAFVPFSDTPLLMESVGVSILLSVALGDVATKGEDGLGVSDANDSEGPSWTGGRGARYLTLADCDRVMDCVVGEDGFVVGVPDGIGGAGDLIDLGLGVRGFGLNDPPEAWGLRGQEEGCG